MCERVRFSMCLPTTDYYFGRRCMMDVKREAGRCQA